MSIVSESPLHAAPTTTNPADHRQISETFARLNTNGLLAGLQVTIANNSDTISLSFGLSAPRQPLTTDTPVPWLCAAKPLTSYVVVAALHQLGIKANTSLLSFVPELDGRVPFDTTVAEMLTHGIYWEGKDGDSGTKTGAVNSSPTGESDSDWCPYLTPGTTIMSGRRLDDGIHRYDVQHGWALGALAAERATGMPFAALAETLLFAPLGMSHSSYLPPQPSVGVRTELYVRQGDELKPAGLSSDQLNVVRPGYSLWSTANDIVRFYQHLRSDSNPVLDQMLAVQTDRLTTDRRQNLTYGMGIYRGSSVDEICQPDAAGHNGYETAIGFCERNVAVGVFTNGILHSPLLERMRLRAVLRAVSAHPLFRSDTQLFPDAYSHTNSPRF